MGEFLMNRNCMLRWVSKEFQMQLMRRLQPRDLAREQRVSGKLTFESGKQIDGLRVVLLSDVSDGEQNAGKGRQIAAMLCGRLQIGNASLFIRGQSAHS